MQNYLIYIPTFGVISCLIFMYLHFIGISRLDYMCHTRIWGKMESCITKIILFVPEWLWTNFDN